MPRLKGHPGGCRVCAHPSRTQIELLLAGGAGQKAVGAKFGLSKDCIHRHWRAHVSESRKATLILGPVQQEALRARVCEEASSVIDHHRITRSGLYDLFSAALEAGDRNAGALLAGRLTEVNNAIGRLTGELASSPLVQQNTVNVFMHDPGFLHFMEELAEALRDHPEARAAVLRKFEELDRREAAASDAFPQLEHQPDDREPREATA